MDVYIPIRNEAGDIVLENVSEQVEDQFMYPNEDRIHKSNNIGVDTAFHITQNLRIFFKYKMNGKM